MGHNGKYLYFKEEVEDLYADEYIFVIWNCIRIKDEVFRE